MSNKKHYNNVLFVSGKRFAGKTTLVVLFLLTGITLHGCIAAAVVATIGVMKDDSGYTATVEIGETPLNVYNAMLRVAKKTPGVSIDKRDDSKQYLEVSRGENSAKANVKSLEQNKTLLTVTATAGEKDKQHEDLALEIVEKICDELGVKYRVVDK